MFLRHQRACRSVSGQGGVKDLSCSWLTSLHPARTPLQSEYEWQKVPPQRTIRQFGEAPGVSIQNMSATPSPLDCFIQFFTVQVINFIVEMTNLNAQKKLQVTSAHRATRQLPPLKFEPSTFEQMKAFLGLTIAMGIVKLPVIAMYWQEKHWIFEVPSFSKIMPRDRYHDLLKFLHFCNEDYAPSRDNPARDKLCKIRPPLNLLETRMLTVYTPRREISIDEFLISFKGQIGFRQFILSKRARFGMKVWVLAESKTGYISCIQLYTGKSAGAAPEAGQATRVVKDLITSFEYQNYHLYVNNFYSSPDLFASLLGQGVYACGTIRPNLKAFPKDLIIKSIAKIQRGFTDWRVSGKLLAQSWVDNKAIYFLSTIHGPEYPESYKGSKSVKRRGGRCTASAGVDVTCP
uniref:piggyBac transposable element-derived protein 4-like n=1 Tax=Styela clava TaxID=7725 RepID=UPI001939F9F4|nr:piggyBac transposable element-derived protein 4-like [Styela clava]XP_039251967.1 piggyBac transposable element-derived protein 4-like [Styela clava]